MKKMRMLAVHGGVEEEGVSWDDDGTSGGDYRGVWWQGYLLDRRVSVRKIFDPVAQFVGKQIRILAA